MKSARGVFRYINSHSIQARLMLLFLFFSLFPLAVVGYFTYSTASNALRADVEEKMLRLSIDRLDTIDRILRERMSDVQIWSTLGVAKIAAQLGSGVGGASDFIDFLIRQHHMYSLIMLLDAEGTCISVNMVDKHGKPADSHQLFLGKNFRQKSWFREALESENAIVTDWQRQDVLAVPLEEMQQQELSPQYSMVFAATIRDFDGSTLGVWANFIDWGNIESILQQGQPESPNLSTRLQSLLLLSDNETIIAHSGLTKHAGEELRGRRLSTDFNTPELVNILSHHNQRIFSASWDGIPRTMIFSRERGVEGYAGQQWGYLMIADTQSINSPILALRSRILLFAVFLILSALLLAYIVGHRVAKPLSLLSKAAAAIANGDLRRQLPVPASFTQPSDSRDEVTTLLYSFARMSQNLHELLRQIKKASSLVNASSSRMSVALHQLSTLAMQQSSAIIQTTGTVEEITTSSREIARSANMLAQFAETTEQEAQTGVQAVMGTLKRIEMIKQANDENMQHVMSLYERSKEIHNIIEVITTIADNTDLIAFNAALEAAGAGEKGKRFGVVADEIRRLANTVATSVKHIHQKISDIQQGTHSIVGAFHVETERIESGVKDMKITTTSLETILGKIEKTTSSLMQISHSTIQQQNSNEQIVTVLHDMSQEMGNFQNIARQTLEIITELKQLSDELQQTVNVFRLDE
ncbi:MAG: methyl-accepting chemotaxis protein [bacterium]|nr:methyl-accepting chemotaxis protein [bacterium]